MNKKLKLNQLITFLQDIEEDISSLKNIIEVSFENGNDVTNDLSMLITLEQQLVIGKEIKNNANKEPFWGTRSNNYYIYKRSNLKSRKRFYETLKPSDSTTWDKVELENKIKVLTKEISDITSKLTKFNNSKTVKIKVFDSLATLPSVINLD